MITPTKKTNTPTEPAVACPTCQSPTFWRSAYGGPLRCAVCEEWPSLAMVGERWTIRMGVGGVLVWEPCLRRGERLRIDEPVPDAETDSGIRWREIEDEDGSWLVIWRTDRCPN
jgi:hypothetical protein